MGCNRFRTQRLERRPSYDAPRVAISQRPTPNAQEDVARVFSIAQEPGTSRGEVGAERFYGIPSQRNQALFPAFAENARLPLHEVQIPEAQTYDFPTRAPDE